MKKIGLFVVIVISISVLSLLSGCTKVEEEIIGTWQSELTLDDPACEITWEFKSDGTLIRTYVSGSDLFVDDCTYTVDKKFAKTLITIDGSINLPSYEKINGIWRVEYFKDNVMRLRRVDRDITTEEVEGGSFLYADFTRLN